MMALKATFLYYLAEIMGIGSEVLLRQAFI